MIPHLGHTNAKTLLDKYLSIQDVISACLNKPKEVMSLDGIGKTTVENLIKMFIGKEPYYKKRNQAKVNQNSQDKIAENKKRKQKFVIQKSNYNRGKENV
jgi:ERCC4-type nuclease